MNDIVKVESASMAEELTCVSRVWEVWTGQILHSAANRGGTSAK